MTGHKFLPFKETRPPRFFYGYIIILASFLILLISLGIQVSFGVFFKPVIAEFGWTRTVTSGVFSLYTVLIGVFAIASGRLSDRFGPRVVLTVCGILIGLGLLLMSRVHAIWQIYFFYGVLVSIGMSGIWVPLATNVARWFPEHKGLATGIVLSGISIGIIVIPLLSDRLISSYNWRTAYIILGSAALAIIVIVAQFLRRAPVRSGLSASLARDTPELKVKEFSLLEAVRTRQFWIICVIFLFFAFGQQIVMVHIVAHATDIRITPTVAATILSVIGFVGIGGKLIMGSLGDRIGNNQVIIIVFILLSFAYLWLRFSAELWMLYLFAAIFGLGYGGFAAVQSALVADFFGLKALGAIFGLVNLANGIGGALGPLVAGNIFDISGSYHWAFIICAVLGVASLALSILLKTTRK